MSHSKNVSRYFKDTNRFPPLTRDEEAVVVARLRNGDEVAMGELVEANLRFVIHIAKQFRGRGLSLCDLIGEGNLGLMEAAKRFDPDKGSHFITYAVWWVRQKIREALNTTQRMIRVPINVLDDSRVVSATESQLAHALGRKPEVCEVADILGVSVERLEYITNAFLKFESLGAEIGGICPVASSIDRLARVETEEMDANVIREELARDVKIALDTLPVKQRLAVSMYFGFGGYESMTLEEVGRALDLTRERIRQIKDGALRALRHSSLLLDFDLDG